MVFDLTVIILAIILCITLTMKARQRPSVVRSPRKKVCITVLGDFGRSPRMQNHACALSANGFEVEVVSYGGSTPYKRIVDDSKIKQHILPEPPNFNRFFPRFLSYLLKVIWQTVTLLAFLLIQRNISHILVQNPPSVPTLPVTVFVCWLRRCSLVIDWHNYGYTVLGVTLGPEHLLVKLCRWIEYYFSSYGDYHFCVTRAMKEDLSATSNITAVVLYDRPSERLSPISLGEKHEFLNRLAEDHPMLKHVSDVGNIFTMLSDGKATLRPNRPAFLVSSTSWTMDEDFSILLRALDGYEEACGSENLPDLVCLVSGKGPMQDFYRREINGKHYKHIRILTLWLTAEDYPKMLASADLGVSLHTSTSGLDLPMKVVDMFGCELPVAALAFSCIYELVKSDVNGYIFKNSRQLGEILSRVFKEHPAGQGTQQLRAFRQSLSTFRAESWEKSWAKICLPVFVLKRK